MKTLFWAGAFLVSVATVLLSSSCAKVTGGERITPETAAFIHPGLTTKQEVLENLGPPSVELQNGRLIAYSWETTGSVKSSWKLLNAEQGSVGPKLSQWCYCLQFDENGRVRRSERIRIPEGTSLSAAVTAWHQQNP